MTMRCTPLLLLLFLTVAASAQLQSHQATAGFALVDAPGRLRVSGFNDDESVQQLILDSTLLLPMVGKQISAISFRRDVQRADALQASQVSFELHISTCATSVVSPSDQIASNQGVDRIKVFSGSLQLPNSPAYVRGNLWGPSNSVRVPFTSGFLYSGGDICLEFSSSAAGNYAASTWAVDAVFSQKAGQVTSVGSSVATVSAVVDPSGAKKTSDVSEQDLVAGGTVLFYARGVPGANGLFLIGTRFLPQPLNLALVNSPQSNVLVEPVASMAVRFGPLVSKFAPTLGGVAEVDLLLPADKSFLGAVLTAQWIEYDLSIPQFLTSNALRAVVSSSRPSVMMSLVTASKSAQGVSSGKVDIGIGHVVKFEYQ